MPNQINTLELYNNQRRIISGVGDTIPIHSNNSNIYYKISKKFEAKYEEVFTLENIYKAYYDFAKGKSKRKDVNEFHLRLIDNLYDLYTDFQNKSYIHLKYEEFKVTDTKTRTIHKASVRDRVVHRLIYNFLYKYFDKKFIYDSYSCRIKKGTHKTINRYEEFFRKTTQNYTKQAYVLKFDIKKCFDSVDKNILKNILTKHVEDNNFLQVLHFVVDSFDYGIPLGNLTSQLFINVYLHDLDFYIKNTLKIKYYIRYADDVVIFLENQNKLQIYLSKIDIFCKDILKLKIHKTETKTVYSGIDFLGFVHFKKHKVLRKSTRKKLIKNYSNKNKTSYNDILRFGDCYELFCELNKIDR